MGQAYHDARRHKRKTQGQRQFEVCQETEIANLVHAVVAHQYTIGPEVCFTIAQPVKREIFAANFRDRVVHHWIFNRINSAIEAGFIHDTYSCRKGKGTLFGIHRAQGFLRAASDDFRRDCWVLRLDIQGFFMAIDRSVLWDLLMNQLQNHQEVFADGLLEPVLRTVVFHDPTRDCVVRGKPRDWVGLPPDKSLFHSSLNCGLPIGNLTSQLFANVYLNPLDHFIKRKLKMRWYGRYVDDMLLVHPDKQVLLNAIGPIRNFLRKRLHLTLHPRKIELQPAVHGFPFLGAYILPYRTYPGRRVIANFRDCLRHPLPDQCKQAQRVQSYLGLLGHCDAWRGFRSATGALLF